MRRSSWRRAAARHLRRPTLRPTVVTAAFLTALAVAMVVVRLTTDALSAWAPNIATSAATVALTITVVERLLRSEGERRRRPRTERVLYWMGLDFRGLTSAIVLDYVSAHTHPQQVPADALELIDLWISEQDAEDRPRRPLDGEWLPMLLLEAQDFASQLERHRTRDLDVLADDLVRALDDCGWLVGQAIQLFGFAESGATADAHRSLRVALRTAIDGARGFADVFRRYGPEWMEIPYLTIEAASEHSRRLSRADP